MKRHSVSTPPMTSMSSLHYSRFVGSAHPNSGHHSRAFRGTYENSLNHCSGSPQKTGFSTPSTLVGVSYIQLDLPLTRAPSEKHFASDFQLVRAKIRRLPPIHRHTLRAVLFHLNRVASHRERNKMDTKNLAIVFGIFGNDDEPKGGDLLSLQAHNVGQSLPRTSTYAQF